jgi:hypothetical protein
LAVQRSVTLLKKATAAAAMPTARAVMPAAIKKDQLNQHIKSWHTPCCFAAWKAVNAFLPGPLEES